MLRESLSRSLLRSWAVRIFFVVLAAIAAPSFASPAIAAPLSVPFDFSRHAIGLDATIQERRVFVMLDTGVDPSIIEIADAEVFGLKIDRRAGSEASGFGGSESARVFPVTIKGLAIASRQFGPIVALAADTSAISEAYGRKIDGVLGYSFLKNHPVLIDYPRQTISLLNRTVDAEATMRSCKQRWKLALQTFGDDKTPIIPEFHFGSFAGPISLDTGSNGGIGLFERALDLPGLRSTLIENGETKHAGARGYEKSKTYVLNESVGFGPFALPSGEIVKVTNAEAANANDKRLANIGNQLFARMKLKILLNYRAKVLIFYGDCD